MQIATVSFISPIPLPLLARSVRAGFPSPADDFVEEEIDLQRLLIANRAATFLVRVAGDSMIGKGLSTATSPSSTARSSPANGDVVVVDVDGERSFKVWARLAGRHARFANPRYPAFRLDGDALVEVWGVVSGSVNPRRRAER